MGGARARGGGGNATVNDEEGDDGGRTDGRPLGLDGDGGREPPAAPSPRRAATGPGA